MNPARSATPPAPKRGRGELCNEATRALVADDYTATFRTSAMYNDLALARVAGESVGAPLAVTAVVQQPLQACIAMGMADIDLMAFVAAP